MLHTTGGYLVYAALTFKYVFDYHPGDIYWCTADVGWVTGHSYLLYGPLACGATTLMFEGVPNWPTPARMAQVVDKHQVNILYTAPTAIRALMAEGDKAIEVPTVRRCAFSVPWASQLTRKRGSGTGKKSATRNVRWSIPGGRPKLAVS
ncbi:acetyl-CoA synthetase [Shigella sonnei]|nr:acetyl-CoA synthetase [Shigella sonnei]